MATRIGIRYAFDSSCLAGALIHGQLDVYYPSETHESFPVLFFVYGGGFILGNRKFTARRAPICQPRSLLCQTRDPNGNTGLSPAPRSTLPRAHGRRTGRDGLGSRYANQVTSERNLKVDLDSIFMMGHSAGATIASTLLLHPTLLPAPLRARIRGINLAGGEYKQRRDGVMAGILTQLYGAWDAVEENMPSALLKRLPESIVSGFPDVIVMVSERDPDGAIEANEEWISMLRETLGKDVRLFVMKRHNHFSPMLALWSGDGEEWAVEFDRWMKARVGSSTGQ
ncbi:alpha/beta-hydrolase [Laetiporus sulphureus 93-53]|uniref:Alpha/beta-hydrolase n=1 Tax=Laetiporus sulphureus 93-53 TaxID=1314785 RepID=A0A165D2Q1_9APHY|nr:alpha/beta-hydrolase [Laetiporus sulphureus 93-53]KZT04038.1 alpha/beta-hydrolase [Laetiporus sulphureus 93-53]